MTNKIQRKIRAVIVAGAIAASFSSLPACAEDYPVGYLGAGYRPYLDGKIQFGYYVDTFVHVNRRQEERVSKRKQIEDVISGASQAAPQANFAIFSDKANLRQQAERLNAQIQSDIQKGKQNSAANGEFKYIKNSDGKFEYFTDGLPTTILNERVVDELGNVVLKDTHNMKYNDSRLLTSYDATSKDNLGNISRQSWTGKYTPDSVFYGSDFTNANKLFTEYTVKEIDPAGNTRSTEWKAGNYDGKLLRAFSQKIEDSIYGKMSFTRSGIEYANNDPKKPFSYKEEGIGTDELFYSTDRTCTSYNGKNQITGYHETITNTQIDGTKSVTDVNSKLTYLTVDQIYKDVEADPDRLLVNYTEATVLNADGSTRKETSTTKYLYDNTKTLTDASTHSDFTGKEPQWFSLKDKDGNTLSTMQKDDGTTEYFYINCATKEKVTVAESDVTKKLEDGNSYTGFADTKYQILYGKPMSSSVYSLISHFSAADGSLFKVDDTTTTFSNGLVNNMQRQLNSHESTRMMYPYLDSDNSHIETLNITTTNVYDNLGNLKDGYGIGTHTGYEFSPESTWISQYTADVEVSYEVILGKLLREGSKEVRHYQSQE
ncbi:MAG: hypothetical protein PHE58_06025 [Candidatus Omnitrophica bacterium]|nr:hypothetical protein [Candidatus Omnitrophota bacterium]